MREVRWLKLIFMGLIFGAFALGLIGSGKWDIILGWMGLGSLVMQGLIDLVLMFVFGEE